MISTFNSNHFNKYISIGCGTLCFLMGVIVIIGWYAKIIILIQAHPSFAPMQYNTALGFLLCGLGVIWSNFKRSIIPEILGSIVFLIGVITLCEYVFGINTGLDEFFIKHYVFTQTSHAGRMAPNTALCFVLVGLSIFIKSKNNDTNSKNKSILLDILGALIVGLSLVALLGYIFNLESAYGWGFLTKMAIHTSIGFIVLGVGINCLNSSAFEQEESKTFPLAITIGLLVVAASFWKILIIEKNKNINNLIKLESSKLKSRTIDVLEQNKFSLERLKSRWENGLYSDKQSWRRDVQNYIKHKNELLAIVRVDENYTSLWVEPLGAGGLVENLDLSVDENFKTLFDASKISRLTQTSGLYKSKKETLQYASASPIFIDDKFGGFVLGIFEISKLLNKYKKVNELQGITVEYLKPNARSSGEELIARDKETNQYFIDTELVFQGITFWIRVVFNMDYFLTKDSRYPEAIGLTSVVLSLVICLLVYFRRKLKLNQSSLEEIVATRTQDLKESENRIRTIANHTPAFISYVDTSERYSFCNEMYEDWFEKSSSSLVGRSIQELHGDLFYFENEPYAKEALNGNRAHFVTKLKKKDREIDIDVHYVPDVNERGESLGFFVLIFDVTEMKLIEKKTIELSEIKSSFVATTAHEFRTPLTTIQGFSELLINRVHSEDNVKKYAMWIHEEAENMASLLSNLLDVSRIESGESLRLAISTDDFHKTVKEEITRFTCFDPSFRFNLSTKGRIEEFEFDISRIQQVLANLYGNATKYSLDEKVINTIITFENHAVTCSISDCGMGMSQKTIDNIFVGFYRGDESINVQGTGLGMTIVQKIIELHNGKIWVDSELGVGSTVHFSLPKNSKAF